MGQTALIETIPRSTLDWLLEPDNPAVAVLTRRTLLGEPDDDVTARLWASRNTYAPVADILNAQLGDGSWDVPSRDYQKYGGSLWQIVFLGDLWADGSDPRVAAGADYAFSRQTSQGTWSANPNRFYMPCLTANVGRGLARMGWACDERIVRALDAIGLKYQQLGFLGCTDMQPYTLNGYCHMLAPKVLLFLGEVPRKSWPRSAKALKDACVGALRDKQVLASLPAEYKQFKDDVLPLPKAELNTARERFLADHQPLHYGDKPGWTRPGFPLSYNSDALEALSALAAVGETWRPEYAHALEVVRTAADDEMRWIMRTSFNDKMRGRVEKKGRPSKWLTLRALQVLQAFAER